MKTTNISHDITYYDIQAEIEIDIMKAITKQVRSSTDDPFIKELSIVEHMLPLLNFVDNYCMVNQEFKEITSDCGKFRIQYLKDNYICFCMKFTKSNGKESWHDSAVIDFINITERNHINIDKFYYSPINRGMKVLDCVNYRLNDNLEHDEAWYFQKLTQIDLPPEEYFIEVQGVLKNIWEGNFVSLTINMNRIIDETHIKEYRKLVQKMELLNA